MKKIIVFGATGDTGSNFVEYFVENNNEKDFEIIAVGRRNTDYFDKFNIEYLQVDITNKEDFKKLPTENVYAVVLLAGFMPARMEGYDPYKYIDVNIIGSLNVLEYCRINNVDRILYAQSFGDIKDHAEDNPLLTVDLPRKFSFTTDHTIYVMTKNFVSDMIRNYHEMYGIKGFIFRLPTIYSYSMLNNHYYVDGKEKKIGFSKIIDDAINGNDIEIWGDKNRKKDMVYSKDFSQMLYKALLVDRDFGFYNVGTGVGTTLEEQIKGIIEVFSQDGKKSSIVYRPDMPSAPEYIMDITPAEKELGYKPKYDYISMLKDLKKYYDDNK